MKIQALTRKSHFWNEDRFIVGNNYWIVIDGATPLIKKNNENLARYMVDYIKKNIDKYKGRIKDRLIKLSSDLYDELKLVSNDAAYKPSASLAYVELIDEVFYVGVLGDCEVTIKTNNNEIIRCFKDDLSKLDAISLTRLQEEASKRNINVKDARKYIIDTLIKHRRLINQSGGYQAYTISDNLEFREYSFSIESKKVKEIYLYSDGFSASFQQLKIYDKHEDLFKHTLDIKLEVEKIVKTAFSDGNCNKYPRFKKIDDITIIQIIN
ncbi:MAG: hypothetical protein IKC22_03375 [Bacilli bacterium]|nr:hypothetical protein [Bacilli bacterium]